MKTIINKFNSLCKRAKIQYFKKRATKNSSNNKQFWNLVKKIFLTIESSFSCDPVTIKNRDKFIDDEKELPKTFNNYYINTVEKTSGIPVENSFKNCDTFKAVPKITEKYKKYDIILELRKNLKLTETFKIPKSKVSDINQLLKNINIKKATCPNTIPPKLIKLLANTVYSHLCNIINKDLESNSFPDAAKIPSVRPIYKKKSRCQVEYYRPVSILKCVFKNIWKIYS